MTSITVSLAIWVLYLSTTSLPQNTVPSVPPVEIAASAISLSYHGPSPVVVHFRAAITANYLPITIRYYWNRNGVSRPIKKVELTPDNIPKFNVFDDWAVGSPGKSFRAIDQLHVQAEGVEIVSEELESRGDCRR